MLGVCAVVRSDFNYKLAMKCERVGDEKSQTRNDNIVVVYREKNAQSGQIRQPMAETEQYTALWAESRHQTIALKETPFYEVAVALITAL